MPALVEAITKEIALRSSYLRERSVTSLYYGGGTPSLLASVQLMMIFDAIRRRFDLDDSAEVTLEANPDDISDASLYDWRRSGINRLSIGLQSFNDQELVWMNRAHTSAQAQDCVKRAQDAGFMNISIDLIYGSRFQDLRTWEQTLRRAVSLGVQHISSYNLTVEKQTKLGRMVSGGKERPVDESLSREQFMLMCGLLADSGFEQYEVSNFARPGFEAIHNSSYWLQQPYLGVGPSAHSYDGISRQWNVRNNHTYIKALKSGENFFEREELSAKDRFNEYVLTRLRTRWGCALAEMNRMFSQKIITHFIDGIKRKSAFVDEKNGVYTLNAEGRLHADGIASDLFLV